MPVIIQAYTDSKEYKMNAWDNLPNAKHIDRVLAFIKNNPASWEAARDAAWGAAWSAAWHEAARTAAWDAAWEAVRHAVRNAAWHAARHAARDEAWYAVRHAAWDAARDAVLALIAYDDCAYMLDMPADQVKLLGLPAAELLYPACLAFENE